MYYEYTAADYSQALSSLDRSKQRKVIKLWKEYVNDLKKMDRIAGGHVVDSIRSGEVAATLLHLEICRLPNLAYNEADSFSYRTVLSGMNWR